MQITWFGQSCFLIKSYDGVVILTDPFDNKIGYKPYNGFADVVTISHHHFDHDYTKNLSEDTKIIDSTGVFNFQNVKIEGIPSYHDKVKGAARGNNTIFVFQVDNLRICHLGDLGYILNDDEINLLGDIDILLIPVGGNFTINAREAAELCRKLQSKIVIPMHYKTSLISLPLDGVDKFILEMKNGEKMIENKISILDKPSGVNEVKILNIE